MRILRKAHVKGVPDGMLFHIIESISENMIEDAKKRFGDMPGFKYDLVLKPKKGYIECFIKSSPYKYDFIWEITRKNTHSHYVMLDARTPGPTRDFLFGMGKKLEDLVNTQWSALINFCVGFVSGYSYGDFVTPVRKREKKKPKKKRKTASGKGHIRRARRKVRERK